MANITHYEVIRDIDNIGAVFSRSRNMPGHDGHTTTTHTSATNMATEGIQLSSDWLLSKVDCYLLVVGLVDLINSMSLG